MVKVPAVLLMFSLVALLSVGCGESKAQKHNSAGVSLENRGKMEEAIAEFDEAIRLDPKLVLAYYNRAQAYFGLDRYERSIQDYDQAISLDPESVVFYTKKGEAYFALGQYERATQAHKEAIRRDPQFALAYYNRGGAYIELGQRDQAIQDYKRAVNLDRRFTLAYGFRCNLYEDLFQDAVAFKDCNGLSRFDSRFAKAYGERGFASFELGEYQQGIRDYDEAIRLDDNRELYNNRGLAYQALGKSDEAFQDFQSAIGRGIGFAPAYYNRGKLLHDLGYYQFATEAYSKAIFIDPLYADAYADRALTYTLLAKDKVAKLDSDRAVELGVDRVELEGAIQELKKQR